MNVYYLLYIIIETEVCFFSTSWGISDAVLNSIVFCIMHFLTMLLWYQFVFELFIKEGK